MCSVKFTCRRAHCKHCQHVAKVNKVRHPVAHPLHAKVNKVRHLVAHPLHAKVNKVRHTVAHPLHAIWTMGRLDHGEISPLSHTRAQISPLPSESVSLASLQHAGHQTYLSCWCYPPCAQCHCHSHVLRQCNVPWLPALPVFSHSTFQSRQFDLQPSRWHLYVHW